jgi:hypothetical protein
MKYWNDSKAIMDYAETTGFEKGMEKILTYLKQGHTIAEAEALLRG